MPPSLTAPQVESSRTRLLSTLRGADRAMRVDELCAALGLSANAVRFQLARLIAAGAVRDEHPPATGPGRPAVGYRAVPAEAVDDAAAYRSLARVLGDALGSLATPEEVAEVGERWARQQPRARRPPLTTARRLRWSGSSRCSTTWASRQSRPTTDGPSPSTAAPTRSSRSSSRRSSAPSTSAWSAVRWATRPPTCGSR